MLEETGIKPVVLVVDDEADEIRASLILGFDDRVDVTIRHPRDVLEEDLLNVNLVLVDYVLDNWPERDVQKSISLKPSSGVALSEILREHTDRLRESQPVAFALQTGHLERINSRLPLKTAQHVIARLMDLEWIFAKEGPRRFDQMVILSHAVQQLPREWPGSEESAGSQLQSILGLDQNIPWFERTWREILRSKPPVRDLCEGGHRLLLLRWLLHQIIPYPSFLWEANWVSARLRVSVEELREIMSGDNNLSADLQRTKYSGMLAGFLGDRWWRGALEDYVYEVSDGGQLDAAAFRKKLSEKWGNEITSELPLDPVVCLDKDLQPNGDFCGPEGAVRIDPDYWPAFADSAWVRLETARDEPGLRAFVNPLDEGRLTVNSRKKVAE